MGITENQQKAKSSMEMVTRKCILCGSLEKDLRHPALLPKESSVTSALHQQYDSNDIEKWWHYRSVNCKSCGHTYADPVFPPSEIEQSYIEQNHDNEHDVSPDLIRKTNDGYAAIVERFLPRVRSIHLDIGCDVGHFIRAAQSLGFQKTIGVEPSAHSAAKAKQIEGVEIITQPFHPGLFAANSISFVSMIHVLDHLPDARSFVSKLKPTLSSGAIVFGVVHNIGSLIAKISGEAWHPFNLIHYEYFTEKTLRQLFALEGFDVIDVVSTKNYLGLHQIANRAPYIPPRVRRGVSQLVANTPLAGVKLGLKLGNIGVVARYPGKGN